MAFLRHLLRLPATRCISAGQDGKLVAVDLNAWKQVWAFQTDGSKKNLTAFSKADGHPDYERVFGSNFYDDMVAGVSRMRAVGMILASPVIAGRHGFRWQHGWQFVRFAIGSPRFRRRWESPSPAMERNPTLGLLGANSTFPACQFAGDAGSIHSRDRPAKQVRAINAG